MTAGISQVVVGRQAIQDRSRAVVGYELLFRATESSLTSQSGFAITGDQMTAEVVFGALNIGLDHIVDGQRIFCNASRGVLLGEVPITLPADQTVIEILESVVPDEEVVLGCKALIDQGYALALDDFVWTDGSEQLLELASIVKLDVRAVRGRELADLATRCRQYDVQLLAEKVETESELSQYLAMGFDLFQGYLLERPVVVSGRTIEAGQAAQLRLAASLLSEDLDFDELDAMLHSDPGLAYQVMQIASLGRAGELRRTINSTRDALILAGSRQVQNWMAVLLARADPGATRANFTKTLVRARACELLTAKDGKMQSSMGFTAGLLSALDLLLGIPVDELCESLAIGDDLAAAAFGDNTELARVIRDAEEYQLAAPRRQRHSELSETELHDAFSQAFVWTMQATTALDL